MRVLLAAFACQPGRGSEPGAGWVVARGAALAGHEVVLLTHPRNRRAIEAARAEDPHLADALTTEYVGLPAGLVEAWERSLNLRGLQFYNLAWQRLAHRRARQLHRARPFDVAHHLTLSTDWVPSGLGCVPGLPLVWGPLGGSERVPTSAWRWLGARGVGREVARRVLADGLRAALADRAAKGAALLLAQNHDVARRFARSGRPVVVRPHVFLEPSEWPPREPVRPVRAGRRRAVFAGRLLAWKGVHLAIDVLSLPAAADWELHVYGDGPERARMARRIAKRGVGDRVVLHGNRPRPEVLEAIASADVLFFPTLREAAGWVVAEALMVGCPVVCVDVGGPPVLLERGGGVAVPPGPDLPARLAEVLAAADDLERVVVRWDTDPLAALLGEWYGRATGAAGPPERPAGDGGNDAARPDEDRASR